MVKGKGHEKLAQESASWEKNTLKPYLRKFPETKGFATPSGIEVKPVYTPLDLKDFQYEKNLGMPGQYPFTRGCTPTCTAAGSG